MAIIETEAALHEAHRDNHTHRDVNGGWLRPAVFGAMDGLVSNLALMTGVAGGTASQQTVVISGLAGLAAGAFSMAAGEYTSVASQRELVEAELDVERRELRKHPADEEAELAALYEARGVEPELAREVARQLSADPEQALEIHAREELGIDPPTCPRRRSRPCPRSGPSRWAPCSPSCRSCSAPVRCGPRCCSRWPDCSCAARWSPRSRPAAGGTAACGSSPSAARRPV